MARRKSTAAAQHVKADALSVIEERNEVDVTMSQNSDASLMARRKSTAAAQHVKVDALSVIEERNEVDVTMSQNSDASASDSVPALVSMSERMPFSELDHYGFSSGSQCVTRKRFSSHFGMEDDTLDTSTTDSIRQRPDVVSYQTTPGVFRFRKRMSVANEEVRDFFNTPPLLPGPVAVRILNNLNRRDLCAAMATCQRLYMLGEFCDRWQTVDINNRPTTSEGLLSLVGRKCQVLRMSESIIESSERCSAEIPLSIGRQLPDVLRLTHLDAGRANFQEPEVLVKILSNTRHLQCVSLEAMNVSAFSDDIFTALAHNNHLKQLDLSMLNLSWAELDEDAVQVLCSRLPASVTHLSLSGTREKAAITDENLVDLVDRCPNMRCLDISDNVSIGDEGFEAILCLNRLEAVWLARCYGITPMLFLRAAGLRHLIVSGCVTEDGEHTLRINLPATRVNDPTALFHNIAKPTVPPSVSSIWGMRTRDIY